MAQEFSLLTYNIHKGRQVFGGSWNIKDFIPVVESADADFVFLQEVQGAHTEINGSQHHEIAKDKWPHAIYGKNVEYESGHHGNAVLSKLPFLKWENINLSLVSWASRSVLHALVQFNGRQLPLHLVCVHLGFLGFEQRRQLEMLANRIENFIPGHEPMVLAGDFNDWSGSIKSFLSDRLELGEAFVRTNGDYAKSYPSLWPFLSLDRVYFRGLEPQRCEVIRQINAKEPSDHLPLYVKFSFLD